jgi:hypothetical protein
MGAQGVLATSTHKVCSNPAWNLRSHRSASRLAIPIGAAAAHPERCLLRYGPASWENAANAILNPIST